MQETSTAAVEATAVESIEMQLQEEKKPPPKLHPALPALTWQSIAEGLGEIFKGNQVRDPVDVSYSNITYTASLGFRKGEFCLKKL